MLQRSRRTSTNVDLFMSEGFRLNGHNGRTNIRGKMFAAYFGVVRHPRAKLDVDDTGSLLRTHQCQSVGKPASCHRRYLQRLVARRSS